MKMYERLWPILLIVALVLIAMPNVSAAQEDDVIEANRALALRYAELRLAGWPEEQLSTIFADDSITHTWALGDGLDATYDRGFMTANTPFDMQDCQAWASVSFALLSCYATGTFGENFGDLTANNADWGVNILVFMEIQSEKIVETWFCYNSFSWFQQLGAIPAPESVTPEPEPKMVIAGGLSEPSVDEVGTAIGTFAQRLNTHDLAGLPALVTEDFVAHDIMLGDLDVVGYQTYLEAMQTGLEDWSLSGESLFFIEGDLVFSLGAVTGMFNQVLNGIEPNGNTVSFPIFTIFRVEDGKIAEIWGWHDSFGFISQLTAPPAE